MEDPGWAWPAWKFGMKRDDLFGCLHDQYNMVPSAIQDPEAFHHDVYEISNAADSADDFHRLMAQRKAQRLQELNDSLASAAIEIIANPKLIGTEQWQYALQLFRTKSLDSLVRYFASYLPEDHFYHRYDSSSTGSSFAESCSVTTASTKLSTIDDTDCPSFFDAEDKPLLTHEPLPITTTSITAAITTELPPSPRSMTMQSDTSLSSHDDIDVRDYAIKILRPARTLSFSGSESEHFAPSGPACHNTDEEEELETSQSDFDTHAASESDLSESRSSLDSAPPTQDEKDLPVTRFGKYEADDDEYQPAQFPMDVFDAMQSDTLTPRPESYNSFYTESKGLARSARALSPKSPRLRRREGSPYVGAKRTPDESLSRIQKPMPDPLRTRPKGRRRVD